MTDFAHKLRILISCCGTAQANSGILVDSAPTAKSPTWGKSICENMDKCAAMGYNIGMLAFVSSLRRNNGMMRTPRRAGFACLYSSLASKGIAKA